MVVHLVLRKWQAVLSIFVQEGIAYRASGVIWILTDLVTAIVMPLVWSSAAGDGTIQGMTAADFTAYYLAILIVGAWVTSHMMWEVATEIREGIFSVYLLRPFSVYQYMFIRNLAWRTIRTILTLPFLLGLALLYRSYLGGADLNLGWEFWLAVVLGHLVSFAFVMMISMIALFVQEAVAIFELYYVPQMFLSGYLFPLALLPEWAQAVAKALPFYYTLGVPADILIGRLSGPDIARAMLIQVAWIVVSYFGARYLWRVGLKHYTGVGM